jgi:protein-L-isoaspartate(D-aspartate) O-methyltransferase
VKRSEDGEKMRNGASDEAGNDEAMCYLHRMVDELVAHDRGISAEWERSFRRVRRDHFVPLFYERDDLGEWTLMSRDNDQWLKRIYSQDSLVTWFDSDGTPLSSSSMPSVMATFLRLLDVAPGHVVLEIGTGTGYNVALLSHRLGPSHVTTVDVDEFYVDSARIRLRIYGYEPTIAVSDGVDGYAPNAPYDRIIATCGVPRIPDAWIDQLKPKGVIVAPIEHHPRLHYGLLVALKRQPDGSLIGRCDQSGAAFMPIRSTELSIHRHRASEVEAYVMSATHGSTKPTVLPPWLSEATGVLVLCKLQSPGIEFSSIMSREGRELPILASWPDGSWARVDEHIDGLTVTQGGPRRLWDILLQTYELWLEQGSPWLDRYGVTITRDRRQLVWLDTPESEHQWEL